jgi:hypothetical protein
MRAVRHHANDAARTRRARTGNSSLSVARADPRGSGDGSWSSAHRTNLQAGMAARWRVRHARRAGARQALDIRKGYLG